MDSRDTALKLAQNQAALEQSIARSQDIEARAYQLFEEKLTEAYANIEEVESKLVHLLERAERGQVEDMQLSDWSTPDISSIDVGKLVGEVEGLVRRRRT
jgi:hypothetical protein